jgi:hypothetical protein
MTRSLRVLALVLNVLLAACGGGGGGSSPDAPDNGPATVGGYVVKGPVGSATVTLEAVSATGARTRLGQTSSAADGSYAFTVVPPAGAVLLLTASGGTFTDEATGASAALTTPLRALDVWSGSARRISITPYSETSVRSVERATTPDWSAASIVAANAVIANWLGVGGVLDFRPTDLRAPVDPSALSQQDFTLSLYSGAFAAFARRLDSDRATSLANGLDGFYQLVLVDPLDDRLFPAFLGGLADFIDVTSFPASAKQAIKSQLLFGSSTTLNDFVLQQGTPHGVSSGAATAPMPDDAFRLIGFPGAHTAFNKRGALIGYTTTATTPDWQIAYTVSVAEMFGDGDVGIGRWNGGAVISTRQVGGTFQSEIALPPYGVFNYAVAAEPKAIPLCGRRRLALVANTEPTLLSISSGVQAQFVGLTPDSAIGLQYLGQVFLAADIGVRLVDGSVVRFRTTTGPETPWASGRPIDLGESGILLGPVGPAGPLTNQAMTLASLVSGNGANKLAVRVRIGPSNDPTEATAVFIAQEGVPDTSACSMVGPPGPGISPNPSDGEQNVFLSFDHVYYYAYRGAPEQTTFGAAGELKSTLSQLTISGPAYELAGNADASIGRVTVTGPIANTQGSRSTPYAVVRPGATVPNSGTVTYDLVAATGVVVESGGSGAELSPGQVSSASLEVTYGQDPNGYQAGTARLRVTGSVDGVGFALTGDPNDPSAPAQAVAYGPNFQLGDVFIGAVSAPSGEYAAVNFHAPTAGSATTVGGALLFRRRQ